jgi:hypothetical protein
MVKHALSARFSVLTPENCKEKEINTQLNNIVSADVG